MTQDFNIVVVPQLGVNDSVATIMEWKVTDESSVSAGETLCTIETTKVAVEVEAEASGYLVHLLEAGEEAGVNQPIALVGPDLGLLKSKRNEWIKKKRPQGETSDASESKATEKAKKLAKELGISLSEIQCHGIIREKDVIEYHKKIDAVHSSKLADLKWDKKRRPVVVYGAGRGAVTVKECLHLQTEYQVVCFIDDNPNHPASLNEIPVYHSSLLPEIIAKGVRSLACAIANAAVRLRILRQCNELQIAMINVIHPQATIAPSVQMGAGNYIKAGAIIDTNTRIGDGCIIDNGAIIAHDNVIGDGCHISPGVVMGSGIVIGRAAIIGIGAAISTSIQIGNSSVVSVGSSVTKNVPDAVIVEGVPAKIVGRRA